MKLNEQLEVLYASKWNDLCGALKPIIESQEDKVKPAYPLLMSMNWWRDGAADEDWYTGADLRVMFFGKETNGWSRIADESGTPPPPVFDPGDAMETVMNGYEDFYSVFYKNDRFTLGDNRYGTFFYGISKFMSLLNQAFPGRKIAYSWNNIIKIGKSQGRGFPGKEIYTIERKHFVVIPEEISILKPDVILFLTGTYDDKIRDVFGDVAFNPLCPTHDVEKITLPSTRLAYRTYHPSAHLQGGMMENYYKMIIEDIRASLK